MSELKITAENFDSEVLKSDKPVLIDFYADWCGPCRMLAPVLEEAAKELGDSIKVGKVNCDDDADLAAKYNVSSIPCLVLIKGGEEIKRSVGFIPKEDILELVN